MPLSKEELTLNAGVRIWSSLASLAFTSLFIVFVVIQSLYAIIRNKCAGGSSSGSGKGSSSSRYQQSTIKKYKPLLYATYCRMLFMMQIFVLLRCVATLLTFVHVIVQGHDITDHMSEGMCTAQGILVQLSNSAILAWSTAMAFWLLLYLVYRQTPSVMYEQKQQQTNKQQKHCFLQIIVFLLIL